MCEWFPNAIQSWKHRLDLHDKAWRHLLVKKHEAAMSCQQAGIRRPGLLGDADTSAQPVVVVEPTADDPHVEHHSESSEAGEEVAACEHAEPIVAADYRARGGSRGVAAAEQKKKGNIRLLAADLLTKPPPAYS